MKLKWTKTKMWKLQSGRLVEDNIKNFNMNYEHCSLLQDYINIVTFIFLVKSEISHVSKSWIEFRLMAKKIEL